MFLSLINLKTHATLEENPILNELSQFPDNVSNKGNKIHFVGYAKDDKKHWRCWDKYNL